MLNAPSLNAFLVIQCVCNLCIERKKTKGTDPRDLIAQIESKQLNMNKGKTLKNYSKQVFYYKNRLYISGS